MIVIVGGTGRVGSATVEALLAQGERVLIVTRTATKAEPWRQRGAEIAVADVHDVDALRAVLRRGRRALLVNPSAAPSSDTDTEERATVRCLLAALEGSGLSHVVALSTYGARPGVGCGDLTVLHGLEEGLQAQSIPAAIMRSAYMMSNWDEPIAAAHHDGALISMLPRDLRLPMVAPKDLGTVAARLLQQPIEGPKLYHVEGPARYTPAEVAEAAAHALHRPVELQVVDRAHWEETFRRFGFSEEAARSYARMTAVTVDDPWRPASPLRGEISLEDHVSASVRHRLAPT